MWARPYIRLELSGKTKGKKGFCRFIIFFFLLSVRTEMLVSLYSLPSSSPSPPTSSSSSLYLSGFTLILRNQDEMSFYARINCHKWWQLWHIHFMECKCVQINFQDKTIFSRNFCHPCAVISWLNYRIFRVFFWIFYFKMLLASRLKQSNVWMWAFKYKNWHQFLHSGK